MMRLPSSIPHLRTPISRVGGGGGPSQYPSSAVLDKGSGSQEQHRPGIDQR